MSWLSVTDVAALIQERKNPWNHGHRVGAVSIQSELEAAAGELQIHSHQVVVDARLDAHMPALPRPVRHGRDPSPRPPGKPTRRVVAPRDVQVLADPELVLAELHRRASTYVATASSCSSISGGFTV